MLNSMRKHATGFAAKIMIAVLVLSFAVWGIEDMLRFGGSDDSPATINGQEIPRPVFEQAYHRELERLRQQLGTNYSPEIARMLRVEHRVAEELVTRQLLINATHELGLLPTDETVVKEIGSMPGFKNDQGAFDKAIFQQVLVANNMNEKQFIDELRREMATGLLLESIGSATPSNALAATHYYRAMEEKRTALIGILSPSMVKQLPTPDEKTLKEHYDKFPSFFTVPESRNISYFTVNSYDLLKNVTIPEDELRQVYDERKELFGDEGTIEDFDRVKNTIASELKRERLDEAVNNFSIRLEDLLAGGASFADAARELSLNVKTVGPVSAEGKTPQGKKSADTPAYATFLDTAFNTEENTTSPLQTAEGTTLYALHVDSVNPENVPPFEEVKGQVVQSWKTEARRQALITQAGKMSQELVGAASPAKVFTQYGVKPINSGALTRRSEALGTGENATPLPQPFMVELFALRPGEATTAHALDDGTFMVALLQSRTAAPELRLEQAKSDEGVAEITEQLAASNRELLIEEYLAYLRQKYDVRINEAALANYTGESR